MMTVVVISILLSIVSLILAIVFAVIKKRKRFNQSILFTFAFIAILFASIFLLPEDVVTNSPEISKLYRVDDNISSVHFQKVYKKDNTYYVEVVWTGKENPPQNTVEAYDWLKTLEEMLSNQFKNYRPDAPIVLEYYNKGEKITSLAISK